MKLVTYEGLEPGMVVLSNWNELFIILEKGRPCSCEECVWGRSGGKMADLLVLSTDGVVGWHRFTVSSYFRSK